MDEAKTITQIVGRWVGGELARGMRFAAYSTGLRREARIARLWGKTLTAQSEGREQVRARSNAALQDHLDRVSRG